MSKLIILKMFIIFIFFLKLVLEFENKGFIEWTDYSNGHSSGYV